MGLLFGVGAGVGGYRMFNQSSKHRSYLLGTGHVLPSTIFVVGGICTRFFPPQSRFHALASSISSCLTFEDYNPTFEEYNPTYTNKTNSAQYLTVTLLCKCTTTTTQRQCYFFLPKKLIKPPCFFFLVFCFFLLPFEFWVGDGRLRDGSSSSSSVTSTSSLISFLRATK